MCLELFIWVCLKMAYTSQAVLLIGKWWLILKCRAIPNFSTKPYGFFCCATTPQDQILLSDSERPMSLWRGVGGESHGSCRLRIFIYVEISCGPLLIGKSPKINLKVYTWDNHRTFIAGFPIATFDSYWLLEGVMIDTRSLGAHPWSK